MAAEEPRILIGTASWADRPLVESGKFYPPDVDTPEERLRFYTTQFPLVEADTTYYALPAQAMTRRWVERTPDGFTFDIKAYSLFTEHPTRVDRMPKDLREMLPGELLARERFYLKDAPDDVVDACWAAYNDGLMPLHESGRLGLVVFQFPRWVFPNRRTHRYFEEIRGRLGPFRAAVEFRNDKWMAPDQRETTLALLGDLGFAYICVDEPQGFSSSVPPIAEATTDMAMVRFHGRNADMWEAKTGASAERFNHWYEPEELDEWVPRIRHLAEDAGTVHLIMNTNDADQGPRNARLLGERLQQAGLPLVAPVESA